ncbi:N-acetylneuraminate synthase family protein [Enterovirga aerilata]|uniref:Cupin domain-containing protein n=1 Tax=Enterovirga aerilata TaxID=2730920 RepID=A0A849IEL9_9HYPH|nr:N-acetylneuraminate synthase family protein [Enterovirga sp. DB1703]NNM74530.1 cupin domain-containing protein [Enterovirga sp. DB1703]
MKPTARPDTGRPGPLFIFEMANNHMGDVGHGLRIVEEFAAVAEDYDFAFAIKLQFRELDTFIHPDFQGRTDIKYIKRFTETRLTRDQTRRLVEAIKSKGLIAMCTPFDEASVDRVVEDGFDILKIASCSFTDWPLLERIATTDLPIIGSTAGIEISDIDNVVAFMRHRDKDFALMTCVAQYPTPADALQLNQIDVLKARYPHLRIGYSTHESPDETLPVAMAVAKGACIFEKHVGIATDAYPLNAYSANPAQARAWLDAAAKAFAVAGLSDIRVEPTKAELDALKDLRRGVFARRPIRRGEPVRTEDVFFAIPCQPGQITANDWSKYALFTATRDIPASAPVLSTDTRYENVRDKVLDVVTRVKALLAESRGVVPGEAELEISHHYGLDQFDRFGITMVTVVNRNYCKKLIVVLPGQRHPEQYHERKEETFHVLHGDLKLELDGEIRVCQPGTVVTIAPGTRHAFESDTGAVFEEISSTHFVDDSFYTDPAIARTPNRKTFLRYWVS